jgi:hypothetical protein
MSKHDPQPQKSSQKKEDKGIRLAVARAPINPYQTSQPATANQPRNPKKSNSK